MHLYLPQLYFSRVVLLIANWWCTADWDSTRLHPLLNTVYRHESTVWAKYIIPMKIELACNFTEDHQLTTVWWAHYFIFTLKTLLKSKFACLLSGYCHSHAGSLIFYEENLTKADKPKKEICHLGHFSQITCPCQSFWWQMPKHHSFIIFLLKKKQNKKSSYPAEHVKRFYRFQFVTCTLMKNRNLPSIAPFKDICKSSSPSSNYYLQMTASSNGSDNLTHLLTEITLLKL